MSFTGNHHSESNSQGDWEQDEAYVRRMKNILERERRTKKLNFRQLEAKCGISFGYLANSERSNNQPTVLTFLRWCRALDLKFEDLCIEAAKDADAS